MTPQEALKFLIVGDGCGGPTSLSSGCFVWHFLCVICANKRKTAIDVLQETIDLVGQLEDQIVWLEAQLRKADPE